MALQQRQNSKLLWVLIGGLTILVLLFFIAQWFFKQTETPTTSEAPISTPALQHQQTAPVASEATAASEVATSKPLVDENVLKAPIPEQESLAKEEVAKLDDIHSQLQEQQANLKAQHADADQLIKLKEEQVKLLEAQMKQK